MEVFMYEDIFASIRQAAVKRNLRERTIQLYCSDVGYFLRCTNKPTAELSLEDADAFLTMKRLEGRSPETHNHYRSSIKFLYKRVLKIPGDDEEVPAMKRERNLPTVLTPQEMNAIIDATDNLKHKAIIATMYSSGLRVSEVIHLHYDDVSRTNMTIHVREAKGRVDRYTILAKKNLDLLTEYWFKCGRPTGILFPSSWTGDYLDIASVNQFFKASARKAGILRRVSSHTCRHSFASHLFENGVDIKYIQSLLGHVDPRSTDVYLHVSNKTLLGIRSPFDDPKGGES
jgi:site-specific recombinase XerD